MAKATAGNSTLELTSAEAKTLCIIAGAVLGAGPARGHMDAIQNVLMDVGVPIPDNEITFGANSTEGEHYFTVSGGDAE